MNRTIGLISTNYSVPGFGSVTEVRPAASIPVRQGATACSTLL